MVLFPATPIARPAAGVCNCDDQHSAGFFVLEDQDIRKSSNANPTEVFAVDGVRIRIGHNPANRVIDAVDEPRRNSGIASGIPSLSRPQFTCGQSMEAEFDHGALCNDALSSAHDTAP